LVKRAATQAASAVASGRRVDSDAFVLRSPRSARAVLAGWRRAHRSKAVAVGHSGLITTLKTAHSTQYSILWREGARLGLLEFRAARGRSDAATLAAQYATLADSYLRTELPKTAWDDALAQIRPNGSVSEQTALEAFVLAFGRLPGVHVPSGPVGTIDDGTLAEAWVLRYLPRLSPGVRRAVDRELGGAPAGTTARPAALGDPNFHPSAAMTATANHWASVYADAAHLNHPLGLTIVAGTDPAVPMDAFADALPVNANGHESNSGPNCEIRVGPALTSRPPSFVSLVLAHEVFHCFEFDLDHSWWLDGDWVIEGLAVWASMTVDPLTTPAAEVFLTGYLATPDAPLFERAYTAVGFWGHAEDTGGSLWPRIKSILDQGSNFAAFLAAGGDDPPFLSTWGSSVFRSDTGGGPPWEMVSPVVPTHPSTLSVPLTSIHADSLVGAAPFTTSQYQITASSTEPLVHVQITGDARLSTAYNYTDLHDKWFCTTSSCACPHDTSGEVPPASLLEPDADLALTGGAGDGTTGTITYAPLTQFCSVPQSGNCPDAIGAPYSPDPADPAVPATDLYSVEKFGNVACSFADEWTAKDSADTTGQLGHPPAWVCMDNASGDQSEPLVFSGGCVKPPNHPPTGFTWAPDTTSDSSAT
jgi:hypothetical protein